MTVCIKQLNKITNEKKIKAIVLDFTAVFRVCFLVVPSVLYLSDSQVDYTGAVVSSALISI